MRVIPSQLSLEQRVRASNKYWYYYFLGICCLAVTSCIDLHTLPPTQPHVAPVTLPKKPKSVRVHVFSHGWHTGVVVKKSDVEKLTSIDWLDELEAGHAKYLEFGWGDEHAFRVKKVGFGTVMTSLFLPTKSVVHLERFSETPYEHYPHSQLKTFDVTPSQLEKMMVNIKKTIRKDHHGKMINVGSGVEADSTFFRARRLYFIGRSCNSWTGKILKGADIEASSLFAPKLMEKLRAEVQPVNAIRVQF